MENKQEQTPKKNSNVIYFLILVIVALLGTDVYLYLKKTKSDEKIVYQNDEKTRLETELDSLEAQITQVNAGRTRMTAEMQAKNDSLQLKIKALRADLAKGKLTVAELAKAQEDVKQLRYFVTKYTADIEELKKQNQDLTTERDTLRTNLTTVAAKASDLEKQNQDLNSKVQVASALKLGGISITAHKVKSNGKESDETKAKNVNKLRINFNVAGNAVAAKGSHDIFFRIIDPNGNLITATDGGTFTADGTELQATYRTSIDFNDDGKTYPVEWMSQQPFQKGTYTIIMYADGYTMGRGSIFLK